MKQAELKKGYSCKGEIVKARHRSEAEIETMARSIHQIGHKIGSQTSPFQVYYELGRLGKT